MKETNESKKKLIVGYPDYERNTFVIVKDNRKEEEENRPISSVPHILPYTED